MYYLAKFCRICIQTSENLVDIEDNDFDGIKFSEKLKSCTEMVITRESLSTQICLSCVNKLRISYQFKNMCKNSTSILQQYLAKLLSNSKNNETFLNSDLQVTLEAKLPRRPRRKRIGKEERCSLLRKLLSKITQDQLVYNVHIKELASLCDRIPSPPNNYNLNHSKLPEKRGGLRDLLDFTKQFDFGYKIADEVKLIKYVDLTNLEKLERFTESFFYDHFTDFREKVLRIRESIDFESDNEDMFEKCEEFEEVLVKQEFESVRVKHEIFLPDDQEYDISSNFVQACYEEDVKQESAEIVKSPLLQSYLQQPPLKVFNSVPNLRRQRTFWPYSVKCRTRGNPFISPELKDQFQAQSFKCVTCSRQFKSPGYLKAHCSKLRH